MGAFLDTGLFVAVSNGSDKNNKRAKVLMEKALKGEYGVIYTSDYVVDESIKTALVRTHDYRIALNVGSFIIESMRIEKLFTGPSEFKMGWEKFQTLRKKPMSFTDCVSLAHMDAHGLEKILSFDSEFDGLANRIY